MTRWFIYSKEMLTLDDLAGWQNQCPAAEVATAVSDGTTLRSENLEVKIDTRASSHESLFELDEVRWSFGPTCPPAEFHAESIVYTNERSETGTPGTSLIWLVAFPPLRNGFITKESRGYRYFDVAQGWCDENYWRRQR
jgi:hypothetical protein